MPQAQRSPRESRSGRRRGARDARAPEQAAPISRRGARAGPASRLPPVPVSDLIFNHMGAWLPAKTPSIWQSLATISDCVMPQQVFLA